MLIDYQEPNWYDNYLSSAHWLLMVRIKRHQVGQKCEICGSPHNLQVHHLTYDRLGVELLEDLQVLCEYHHKKIHDIDDTYSGKLAENLRLVLDKLQDDAERRSGQTWRK